MDPGFRMSTLPARPAPPPASNLTGAARMPIAASVLATVALLLDLLALVLLIPQGAGVFEVLDGSTIGGYVLGATYPIVGWIIASRRPSNAIGWIFLAIGLSQALDTFASQYATVGLVTAPGSLAGADLLSWVAIWAWVPGFTLLLTVSVLLFPDGKLPSPRWRVVPWLASLALFLLAVPIAIVAWPSRGRELLVSGPPVSSDPLVATMVNVEFGGLILLAFLGIVSVIGLTVRYRRSRGVERVQLKWFVAAGAIEIVALIASAFFTVQGALANFVLNLVFTPLLPIAATIAILRYRLYDIDRIVSRTVGWTVVTILLVAAFAGGVIGLQGLLSGVTQGQTLAIAASTLAALTLFQPLRRRVQSIVDRRFDRGRYDARRTAEAFSERLRGQVVLDEIQREIATAVDLTVRPVHRALWLRKVAE